jgi:hypothetical protein
MKQGEWVKSRKSQSTANCVEVNRVSSGVVMVRNSRDPEGNRLVFTEAEFEAFLTGAREGDFDK